MKEIEIGDFVEVIRQGGNNSNHPKWTNSLHRGNSGIVTNIEPEWTNEEQYTNGQLVCEIDNEYYLRCNALKVVQKKNQYTKYFKNFNC